MITADDILLGCQGFVMSPACDGLTRFCITEQSRISLFVPNKFGIF